MVKSQATSAREPVAPSFVPFERRLDANLEWAMSEGSLFFEDRGKVQESLSRVTRRLNELGIPYAVAGGMALYRHGFRRFTEDVDILVTRDGLKRIHEALDGRGFVRPFEKSKNLRDADTGVKIEFLLTGDYPGDGKPKEVAFPDPADVAVESGEIKILGLPSLINLKLASGLSGADRKKDLVDVEELVKVLGLDESFATNLPSSVQSAYREICHRLASVRKRFVLLWRNKWLTSNSTSIDDMIQSLRTAVDELEAMRKDGVLLDSEGGTSDDYAYLYTHDPAIAKKYDMVPEDEYFDEDTN
jgi:hypothetical protein